jgi:hypothetical protein
MNVKLLIRVVRGGVVGVRCGRRVRVGCVGGGRGEVVAVGWGGWAILSMCIKMRPKEAVSAVANDRATRSGGNRATWTSMRGWHGYVNVCLLGMRVKRVW